jgi:hypothetical protein
MCRTQQQIRHVDDGDEQHEHHRGEDGQQRRPHVARHGRLQELDDEAIAHRCPRRPRKRGGPGCTANRLAHRCGIAERHSRVAPGFARRKAPRDIGGARLVEEMAHLFVRVAIGGRPSRHDSQPPSQMPQKRHALSLRVEQAGDRKRAPLPVRRLRLEAPERSSRCSAVSSEPGLTLNTPREICSTRRAIP